LVVERILLGITLAGAAAAVYGMTQVWSGLPSWDQAWVNATGYASLHIGGTLRPFGTLSSAAEYATLMALALVLVLFGWRRRKVIALLLGPVLVIGLLFASARGAVVLAAFSLVVVSGLRTGRRLGIAAAVVGALWFVTALTGSLSSPLLEAAHRTNNPLIVHQVEGLVDPFNPDRSTLGSHQKLFVNGFLSAVDHPLGLGTSSTNLASFKFGGQAAGSEVDISDEFTALGLIGGSLYALLVLLVLVHNGRQVMERRGRLHVYVMGALLVTLGAWLNGGFYAIAPLIWLLIGWTARTWIDRTAST
jgi:hypothetical protein